jgi:hypothetical protein
MDNNAVLPVAVGSMEIANRVAQSFRLKEIFLVDAKVSRDPGIASPESLDLEHKYSTETLSWGGGEGGDEDNLPSAIEDFPDPDIKRALVAMFWRSFNITILCNFQVAAFSGETPDKLVMKIEASFCTSLESISGFDLFQDFNGDPPEYYENLGNAFMINPIFNAWPYWREFVQSMSTRMGYPALTVPLLEIVPEKSITKEVKSPPLKKKSTRQKKVSS